MSLLRWLGLNRTLTYETDSIWLSRKSALAGLARDAAQWLGEDAAVLVVAHFPAALAAVQAALDEASVPWRLHEEKLAGPDVIRMFREVGEGALLLVPAVALRSDLPLASGVHDRTTPVAILGAERHPLRAPDERIEQFAATIPYRTRLTFYVALEDPLLARFTGDWVKSVLRNLGMKEDQSINSPMVTKRIKAAQLKLAQDPLIRDLPSDSVEEWCRNNLRDEV